MRIRKRLLAIVLSSALIVSNLSTAGFSVTAEGLDDGADVINLETLEETYDSYSASEDESGEITDNEDSSEENESEKEIVNDTDKESEEEADKETEEDTENDTDKESEEADKETEEEMKNGTDNETEEEADEKSDMSDTEDDLDIEKEFDTENEENHTPENITNQITQIKLNLGNAWYMDSEYGAIDLEEYDGIVDYSTVPNISTVGLDVLYRLTQDGSDRTVRAGDWYEITLPSIATNIRMTGGESFGSDIPMDILDIQIQGNTIKAIFKQTIDDINVTQIHGKQHIAFEVNKDALTEELSSYTVNLQPENNCELRLPAKALV